MISTETLTLIAIVVGPILAVLVTRFIDERRERRARQMDVFRTLMRTRRTPQAQDHVGALNLVEIEFQKHKQVIASWNALFKHFGTTHPRRADEQTEHNTDASETRIRDERFYTRMGNERASLLAKLLHEIAKVLKFKAEQLELFEGGYSPQGWSDLETEQSIIRRYFIDLYFGKRVVPITVIPYPEKDKTPSPTSEEIAVPVDIKPVDETTKVK